MDPASLNDLPVELSEEEDGGGSIACQETDDVTIVVLDDDDNETSATLAEFSILVSHEEERRRAGMVVELRAIQRQSCILFLLIGCIPTVFLLVAVVSLLRENIDCPSFTTSSTPKASSSFANSMKNFSVGGITCWNAPRSIRTAYSSHCICGSALVND